MTTVDPERWVKMATLARENAIVGMYDEAITHFTQLLNQIKAYSDT